MADTDLTPEEAASDGRIPLYNVGAYDPVTNPRGFDEDGHTVNLMPLTNDVAILGRMARRMALSTRADVLLTHADRDLTAEDAGNTYQDRLATAANLVVSAGHVSKASQWAGAAENVEVEPGKFSALHWANRAFAAAASVNLPVAGAGDGLKFLQMKADGSGYQLATIATATAQQIADGTGTGFVNSQTLGPILDALETAAAAASASAPPIGSYMFWPVYSAPPGDNWIEAKGQVVSLTSYPGLANVIIPYSIQYGRGDPGYQAAPYASGLNGGSGANSLITAVVRSGRRIAVLQTQYARLINEATGVVKQGDISASDVQPLNGNGTPRPILRDNDEVVYMNNSGLIYHLDLAPLGTGGTPSPQAPSGGNIGGYNVTAKEFIIKLPNGTLVVATNKSDGYFYISKLPAGALRSQWEAFQPGGQTLDSDFRAWQTKNGDLYIACKPAASGASAWTVYKTTTGASWAIVGSIPYGSANGTAQAVAVGFSHQQRERDCRLLNNVEESPNGQQIIVRLSSYAWLMSADGGASWVTRSPHFFGYPATIGMGAATGFSFIYDVKRSRWLMATDTLKPGNSTQHWFMVWSSTDLVNWNLIFNQTTNLVTSSVSDRLQVIPLKEKIVLYYTIASTLYKNTMVIGAAPAPVTISPGESSQTFPQYLIRGYKEFDGWLLNFVSTSGSGGGVRWVPNDGSAEIIGFHQMLYDALHDFFVMDEDNKVGNYLRRETDNATFFNYGQYYPYNKSTERKLPNLSVFIAGLSELYRESALVPKAYMRVK